MRSRADLTFRIGLANINGAHSGARASLSNAATLDPRPLISHVMPLDDAAKGYEIFNARQRQRDEGAAEALKIGASSLS